jgi:hypothetical protein
MTPERPVFSETLEPGPITVKLSSELREVEIVAKEGATAYKTALSGGKHSGFLRNYTRRSPNEINKAINSLQSGNRGINIHLDKIANPTRYVPNWNTLSPSYQQSLINGWQSEITNGREQIEILRYLLGN